MRITIFGIRFEGGSWKGWEHSCDQDEFEAVTDSAIAKAFEKGRPGKLTDVDFLEGARYVFDVAFGPQEDPRAGDIEVFGMLVNRVVIGHVKQMQRHYSYG